MNNAVYLINRSSSRSIDKTSYEKWYGNKPDLSHLRVFGCAAYALDPHAKSKGKMAPRSHKTNLVSYEANNQYRLYNPDKNSIIQLRDVIFNEAVGANKAPKEKGEGEQEDEGVDNDPLSVSLSSTISMPPPIPLTPVNTVTFNAVDQRAVACTLSENQLATPNIRNSNNDSGSLTDTTSNRGGDPRSIECRWAGD